MAKREEFNLELHHSKCFNALLKVNEVLTKHSIEYILLAGTTLGAVRHGGFIPWDDDIDLGIYRKDVKRVARILLEELPDEFVYQDRTVVSGFPRLFGKIIDSDNGYGCIDFFPIVKTSNSKLGRSIQWNNRKILFKLYKAKIGYSNDKEHAGLKEEVKLVFASALSKFISMNRLENLIDKNESRYETKGDNKYFIILYGAHSMDNETINASWLRPYSFVSFNGVKFPTVGNIDAYLKNMYGDYMTPPKDADRVLRHNEFFQ